MIPRHTGPKGMQILVRNLIYDNDGCCRKEQAQKLTNPAEFCEDPKRNREKIGVSDGI